MHAIFKFGRQHQAVHKTATKALCAPFAEALREGAVSATTLLDPLSPGCLPLAAAGVATCASEKPWTPYPPLRRLEDSWAGVGPIARATDGLFARPKQQQQPFSSTCYAVSDGGAIEPAAAAELNPLLQTPTPAGTPAEGQGGAPSRYGPGKAVAKLRGIAISPKKMTHFVAIVRRLHVEDALTQCHLSPKKAAKITAGVIQSARANAETNHGLDPSKLTVDAITVGKGTHLKRTTFHGKGRMAQRLRYRCHLEVVVKESDRQPKMQYVRPLLERPRRHAGFHQMRRERESVQ